MRRNRLIARVIRLIPAAALMGAGAPGGTVLFAGGAWAAIDRGSSCEALSRSVRVAIRGKAQPMASFAFTPDHRRWGELHVQLSREARPGASVMLRIGGQPFLLAGRGGSAWSTGTGQEQAIQAAVRQGGVMRAEARDPAGRRFADAYPLDGAPTAIDSAAARCALRGAGKIG
ncbi:MAG: hypothetical protein ABIO80_05290 [Sphingomicrobium sp.]